VCTGLEWLMVASTAVQAVGAINEGEERQQMYDYQAAQSEADAQVERELGEVRAAKVRRIGRSTQSEARAALAASGVEVNAGTAVRIDTELARRYEEDAGQEILAGMRRGERQDSQAGLYRRAGENASAAGYSSAFGSVLAGGAEIGKGWKTAVKRPASIPFAGDGTVRIA